MQQVAQRRGSGGGGEGDAVFAPVVVRDGDVVEKLIRGFFRRRYRSGKIEKIAVGDELLDALFCRASERGGVEHDGRRTDSGEAAGAGNGDAHVG